ncbi:hypothetical protein CBL_10386 [Carabus blaptoides fortunei]
MFYYTVHVVCSLPEFVSVEITECPDRRLLYYSLAPEADKYLRRKHDWIAKSISNVNTPRVHNELGLADFPEDVTVAGRFQWARAVSVPRFNGHRKAMFIH